MRIHKTTLSEAIQAASKRNGMTLEVLCKKSGISTSTMTRHLKDSRWDRRQMQELHRYLHFTPEEMAMFFEEGR